MKGKCVRRLTPALAGASSVLPLFKNTDETSPSVLLKEGETCIVNLLSELTTARAPVMSDMMYNSRRSGVVEQNASKGGPSVAERESV